MRKVSLLSIVVPCHNEQEVLPETYARLTAVLKDLQVKEKCRDYELLFVDNGSNDDTLDILKGLFEKDSRVEVVSLRRNFGYQGSISAGLAQARGDAVVAIDADLQDPPEKIGEMLDHYENDYDLVLGVRSSRASDSFFKRVFSQWYYRLLKWLDVDVVYNHGDFRLMARSLVDEFNALEERSRFIRAMILKLESRYEVVYYERQPRRAGKTKFSVSDLFSLCLDGITSFSISPLRMAAALGFVMCVMAFIGMGWILYIKFCTNVISGWASTLMFILGFSGIQLIFLGLIGEYIGRMYLEVKRRPVFVVRRRLTHH